MRISVVISAFNEESKIQECLESVKWADEVIVIDNSSIDRTAEIAKKFTKHVFQQKNDPANIDLQKNFGIEKAKNEWVLLLDADERVTRELEKEIKKRITLSADEHVNGYWIARKNIIFGKWIEHCGWYPDYQLRLFKKEKGRYEKTHYHEPIHIDGKTEYIDPETNDSVLLHLNYESVSQFFHRNLEHYALNEADDLLQNGYAFHWADAIRFPLKEFLSRYFARDGYKDGYHGFMLSLLMAVYHFAVFCYIWERKNFVDIKLQNSTSLMSELGKEMKKGEKELRYWIYGKKIEEENNMAKKISMKIRRKLHI